MYPSWHGPGSKPYRKQTKKQGNLSIDAFNVKRSRTVRNKRIRKEFVT